MSAESTIQIQVLYFASLADEAGCSEESMAIVAGTSLGDLYQQLQDQRGLSLPQSLLRVAINDYFASWHDDLYDGDSVAFIAPVAGG